MQIMEFLKAPVTALEYYREFIFAGVGSYLKVYKLPQDEFNQPSCLVDMRKILKQHVIHEIQSYTDKQYSHFLIYGGREWTICQLPERVEDGCTEPMINIIHSSKAQDWIWDISPIYSESDTDEGPPPCVALALGHNSVLLYDWVKGSTVREIHCEEKCILYSAHFLKQKRPTWDSLLLCSGTVFNQVVIWAPGQKNDSALAAKVLERIQAHDGVIFDMNFDLSTGLLVTASDDRSIRLWNCKSLQKFSCCYDLKTNEADETICLCRLYGHESRVWRAQCVKIDDNLHLISIGEDGSCIVWSLHQNEEMNGPSTQLVGKVIRKLKCHKGRNIWSLALDKSRLQIGTGGGDGGIRMWNVKELLVNNVKMTNYPIDGNTEIGLEDIGTPKSISLCSAEYVIVHTDAGVLLRFDLTTSKWVLINSDPSYKSYAVMRVSEEFNMVAIGNTKGQICILKLNATWKEVVTKSTFQAFTTEGKVHNVTWSVQDGRALLFASGPQGEFVSYEINVVCNSIHYGTALEDDVKIAYIKKHCWTLPLAKHRWHMGVAHITKNETYIICGDRRGSVHLFHENDQNPINTLHGIHGKNGVTSLKPMGDNVLSVGRDGVWREIKVDFGQKALVVLAQKRAAQGMEWLESIISTNTVQNKRDIAITGFHGRNFTVWSNVTGDTLLSIECGGGHRDWSFKVHQETNGRESSVLAFLKAGVLHVAQIPYNILKEKSVIEPSFHGGQITCVKCIEVRQEPDNGSSMSYLITGSEDTKLILSAYVQDALKKSRLQTLCIIDNHISSVRTVATLPLKTSDNISETLLVSGGGRATLNCYSIKIRKNCRWEESVMVEYLTTHSLNKDHVGNKKKQLVKPDPETRYMALTAWSSDENCGLIAGACSDATLRIFHLNIEKKSIQLIAQSTGHSHCFLTVAHFTVNDKLYVIAGATDGSVTIWDQSTMNTQENMSLSPCSVFKCHMSGINAMDVLQNPRISPENSPVFSDKNCDFVLLATGGDDNSIQLSLLRSLKNNNELSVIKATSVPKAHSTQITGLRLIDYPTSDHVKLISVSIDQRLTTWVVSLQQNGDTFSVSCDFYSSILTNIADVSFLETWTMGNERNPELPRYFTICGQGIEILTDVES